MRGVLIVACALVAAASAAKAASVPDPVAGRKFAQIECGRCHVIDERPGKEPPPKVSGAAPPFETLAHDPDMTVDKMRQTLRLPHGAMATVLVADKDIDNIISYIVSLSTR